ncbi:ABC transporter substrate-binding protein [Micropruina sp.]|uniref:ABC transporter substrate-binding protein n=1 Tax=Micropruina sp. TaxID=2737536 RepID=UPI0039E5CB5D
MMNRTAARVGAVLFAGALALSACAAPAQTSGSPAASSAASSSTPALVPAAEGKTTYPLTLDTQWGSTELKQRPERIAAVTPSQDDAEILAALGVTPVLANEYTKDVWLEEALSQPIPNRFNSDDATFPVEQIAKAEPDLIVVLNTDLTDDFAKLSTVAPVLAINQSAGTEGTVANDWEANIRRIGEVLDLQAAAQKVLDDEEAFFANFRTENPDLAGLTASYVVYYGDSGGLQFHSSVGSPAESVLERMGLAQNPNAATFKYRQEVSQELLATIDADVIIFSDNSGGKHAKLTKQPLFKKLKAVQADHLILIDNQSKSNTFVIDGVSYDGNLPWALARSGPLSGTWAASKLAPALKATLAA